MKNFNKDNSMKKYKCVLGMVPLVFAMVGNAIADEPVLPVVPEDAMVLTVTNVTEWNEIQDRVNELPASKKDLIIQVSGDIKFSSNIGEPWSGAPANLNKTIDMGKRNVYILGDENSSSNSLSGILMKGPGASLFTNVDTVYVEEVDFRNCYLLAQADDAHNSATFLAHHPRGVYLNKVTLENVGIKGVPDTEGKQPIFSTVGFLADTSNCSGARCGSFIFQDVSVDGLSIDSLLSIRMGGFIGYVGGSNLIQSSDLKNISVVFSTNSFDWTSTTIYLGGVAAAMTTVSSVYVKNSSIELAPLKLEAVDFSKRFIHMGGLAGELESGSVVIEKSKFSGDIEVVNNFNTVDDDLPMKLRAGGVFGYWMPRSSTPVLNLQMDSSVSTVDISVNLEAPHLSTSTNTEELDFSFISAVGGFFGSMAPGVTTLSGSIDGSSYSGKIDYKSKDEAIPSIGGFIGVWANGPITFNDNVVSGSKISYQGPYASIGALVGTVKNTKAGVFVNNLKVEKDIEASLSPVEGASIGGVFGLATNSPVELNNVSIRGDISANDVATFEPPLTHVIDLSMGGAIGYMGNSNPTLKMENISYEGRLTADRSYVADNKAQYVGGLVGKLKNVHVSIEKASVVGKSTSPVNKDLSLMSVSFAGGTNTNRFEPVYMGGLIGGSPFAPNGAKLQLFISEASVSGEIAASGMCNSDTSYFAGFVGAYAIADSVKISDSYYNGGLSIDMTKPSANKVSGLMTLSVDANDFSLKNSYVYDEEAATSNIVTGQRDLAMTKTYMFSLLDYLEDNGVVVDPSSPAFAYNLNQGETEPLWYYDESENDGLPQLASLKGKTVVPTGKVTLLGFNEGEGTPSDVEIYTDANGKWALTSGGKIFKDDLSVNNYDPVKKKLVVWKQEGGDLVWKGLAETSAALTDGMKFAKELIDLPKVTFSVDSTGGSSGKDSRVVFWDSPEYSLVDSAALPVAVFKLVDGNNDSSFYKGSFWKVAGQPLLVHSSDELIDYVIHNPVSEVTLEFALDSLYKLMLAKHNGGNGMTAEEKTLLASLESIKYQTKMWSVSSPTIKIQYTSDDHDVVADFRPQLIVLPKVQKFSIIDIEIADSAATSFAIFTPAGDSLGSNVLFGEEIVLTGAPSDTLIYVLKKDRNSAPVVLPTDSSGTVIIPGPDSTYAVDSTGKTIIVPIDSIVPSDSSDSSEVVPDTSKQVPVVDESDKCADSVTIADVRVAKSGTAAQFTFKLDAPSSCTSFIKPKVVVSGPDSVVLETVKDFSKNYKFVLYPLNPGTYSFKVIASSKVSKTVKEDFSADIELRGRVWTMVAFGSWPKNVLKDAKPTIYTWNESNPIGDYWQYEAFPKNGEADEMVGYWVRTESNVEFSLDLPLKAAESDSLSWTVEKKFSGWNMLANPYSWNIYVGSVEDFKSSESESAPIWRWDAFSAGYMIADTLYANEAFWVKADRKRTISVSSKPVFPAAKVVSGPSRNPLFRNVSKNSWSMMLVASTEDGATDSWNVLGVGSKDIAIAEPPAGMESGVAVSFVGDDALLAKRILAKTSADEYSWKVNVKSAKGEKVNLSLEGLDEVRAMGYRAVLVMDGKTYEWGDASTISVDVSGSKTAELKVVPAKAQVALSKGISDMKYSVAAGEVSVNFNVSAEMAGKAAEVRLLDMNGNVLSMARGKAHAGTNDMRLGSVARNGVYVLMVRVGSATRSARIAL